MRETSKRTVAKALTWQVLGLLAMAAAGYWMTGSLAQASGFSLAMQAFALLVYILHERLWGRVDWGLQVVDERRPPCPENRDSAVRLDEAGLPAAMS